MKRAFFVLVSVLVAAAASAQPWGYDASWSSLPMTVDTRAVKLVLDRGLCEQSGVDALNAVGVKAAVAMPGAPWPCTDCVQWYGKGAGCDGKYQYVSVDGPYPKGWEIKWSAVSWTDSGTPPPGFGTHHPTTWTFFPFEGPTYAPPPIVTPPPVVTPPPMADVAPLLAKLDALANQIAMVEAREDAARDAQTASIRDAVNNPAWFSKIFGNKYVQMALTGLGAWLGTKAAQ